MYVFMIVGAALALAVPLSAAAIIGLAFALIGRAGGIAPLAVVSTLRMNEDGTLTEADDSAHILAA